MFSNAGLSVVKECTHTHVCEYALHTFLTSPFYAKYVTLYAAAAAVAAYGFNSDHLGSQAIGLTRITVNTLSVIFCRFGNHAVPCACWIQRFTPKGKELCLSASGLK